MYYQLIQGIIYPDKLDAIFNDPDMDWDDDEFDDVEEPVKNLQGINHNGRKRNNVADV